MKIKIITTLKDEYVKKLSEQYGVNSLAEIRGALKAHFKQGDGSLYVHVSHIEKNNIDIECSSIEEMGMAAKESVDKLKEASKAMGDCARAFTMYDPEKWAAKTAKLHTLDKIRADYYEEQYNYILDQNGELVEENKKLKKKIKDLEKKLSK